MPSRLIEDLLPELQLLYRDFEAEMKKAGLAYIVTCTYRSQQEQDTLYAKGRTAQGPIVTWAPHSLHTQRKAFDIAMLDVHGKVTWDETPYSMAGLVGKTVGLQWGGDFKHRDMPHFQLREA